MWRNIRSKDEANTSPYSRKIGHTSVNNGDHKQYNYPNDTIMIDIGVSEHAVNAQSLFQSIDPVDNVKLELADVSSAGAIASGTVLVELQHAKLLLRKVYLVVSLKSNILSCSKINQRGATTQIARNNCIFY